MARLTAVDFNRPQVKIVIDRAGQPVKSDSITDLGQKDRSGRFTRTVERTYDARNFGINITGFFFGDRAE